MMGGGALQDPVYAKNSDGDEVMIVCNNVDLLANGEVGASDKECGDTKK